MIQKARRAARQRPLVRWHGGKFRLKEFILAHLPPHSCYVEPYGGGGSILIHKPKSTAEIYNDLDIDIVNLMWVLRQPELAPELIRLVELTPYSRFEFDLAYEPTDDLIERAHRLVIRSYMGHGADGAMMNYKTGFRGKVAAARKSMTPRDAGRFETEITRVFNIRARRDPKDLEREQLLERTCPETLPPITVDRPSRPLPAKKRRRHTWTRPKAKQLRLPL